MQHIDSTSPAESTAFGASQTRLRCLWPYFGIGLELLDEVHVLELLREILPFRLDRTRTGEFASNVDITPYGDVSKPWYLVNPKIAGKWMFIPLKMVLIGIDPYPYYTILHDITVIHPVEPSLNKLAKSMIDSDASSSAKLCIQNDTENSSPKSHQDLTLK